MNVRTYVTNIREALIAVDAAGKPNYESAAASYLKQLDALEAEIKTAFADIPKPKRRVITSHDAFAYYGNAYGVTFLSPQGVTGDSHPTAKDGHVDPPDQAREGEGRIRGEYLQPAADREHRQGIARVWAAPSTPTRCPTRQALPAPTSI